MLGVSPAFGRAAAAGRGDAAWRRPRASSSGTRTGRRRFNEDPTVAGRRVVVNGQPFTIAGVVPEAFQGVYALVEFDAYLPAVDAADGPSIKTWSPSATSIRCT